MTELSLVLGTGDKLQLELERVRDILQRCQHLDEAKEIRDKTAAVAIYLRKRDASVEIQNYALEQVLWAERRMGQLLDEQLAEKGRPTAGKCTSDGHLFLDELGISRNESSRAQKMAGIPEATFTKRLERAKTDARRLTVNIALGVKTKSESPSIQDRRTPRWLFDALNERFGPFKLDAFASGVNHLCDEYYTREDNACRQAWVDVTFANPDFAEMEDPLRHAVAEAARGVRSVILGPVGCSQEWYHKLSIQGTIYVPDKRISYDLPDGSATTSNADRDTIVMAFGREHVNPRWKRGVFRVRTLYLVYPKKQRGAA
jgi:phage N-6-adenine-methyltransferase